MLVYHVTSKSAAESIITGGFVHPSLDESECKAEHETAKSLGVLTRPIFTSPTPIEMDSYGGAEAALIIELDEDSYYTVYPGDSGINLGAERFYTPKDYEIAFYYKGEIHLWEGVTRYRVLGVVDLTEEWARPVRPVTLMAHPLEVIEGNAQYGYYAPVGINQRWHREQREKINPDFYSLIEGSAWTEFCRHLAHSGVDLSNLLRYTKVDGELIHCYGAYNNCIASFFVGWQMSLHYGDYLYSLNQGVFKIEVKGERSAYLLPYKSIPGGGLEVDTSLHGFLTPEWAIPEKELIKVAGVPQGVSFEIKRSPKWAQVKWGDKCLEFIPDRNGNPIPYVEEDEY